MAGCGRRRGRSEAEHNALSAAFESPRVIAGLPSVPTTLHWADNYDQSQHLSAPVELSGHPWA
jgi:hypothetical protein